jgi:hypothetical protein
MFKIIALIFGTFLDNFASALDIPSEIKLNNCSISAFVLSPAKASSSEPALPLIFAT